MYTCTYIYIPTYINMYKHIYISADQVGVWGSEFDSVRFEKRQRTEAKSDSEAKSKVK